MKRPLKNLHAVKLGRLGGIKGGTRRWAGISKAERSRLLRRAGIMSALKQGRNLTLRSLDHALAERLIDQRTHAILVKRMPQPIAAADV
jgi:hypothetical protein